MRKKQLAETERFAAAARILARIGRHRIGPVGGPSMWLTYSLPDSEALAGRLGIGLIEISMEEFRDAFSSFSLPEITALTGRNATAVALAREARGEARPHFGQPY